MKKINWSYTLGEILIVIIGISIAFSLNKCAETKQHEKLERLYLENLKDDIQTDKTNLEQNLGRLQDKKTILESTFRYFNPTLPKRDSVLVMHLFRTAEIIEFSPKTTTHQTLINSGDLKLITNFDLKTAIQEHYRSYGKLEQDYDRMVNISKKYIADFFIYYVDMDKFKRGEKAFTNEKLLRGIIQSMNGAVGLKITSTENTIESCSATLEHLNTALKK